MADNALTIKQKGTLPVSKTRQDKSLFCSLSGVYLPPLTVSCTLAVVRPSVARPPQPHPAPHGPLRYPSPPGMSLFRCFRCYLDRPPALHGLLRYPSPPGMSLFRRFRCYLDRPHAPHGPLRHPPLPGVSLFRHFRCYLDRPPASHSSLRHPPPPGVSLFRRFRCHLDCQPALQPPLCPVPLPGVSRFRRIGSYLRRVIQALTGTMAAGAREQAASCDAFVLSRSRPLPMRRPAEHFRPTSSLNPRRHHRKNLRYPEKIAKKHENMAKRAKNVLLAISSGGGIFIFL